LLVSDKYSENDHYEFDFEEMNVLIKGKRAKVTLYDTAGTEQHSSFEGSYFRGLVGFFLVYDVGTYKSFERLDYWRDQIDHYAADGVKIVLCANKADLTVKQRAVVEFDGKKEAARLGLQYFEMSAKTGMGVKQAFDTLCQLIVESDIPGLVYDGPQDEVKKQAGFTGLPSSADPSPVAKKSVSSAGKGASPAPSPSATIRLDDSVLRDTRKKSNTCCPHS